jgi:hypothetical protein
LLRSDDPLLHEQLATLQAKNEPQVWPADVFAPVALHVELVFQRLGLTQLELPIAA